MSDYPYKIGQQVVDKLYGSVGIITDVYGSWDMLKISNNFQTINIKDDWLSLQEFPVLQEELHDYWYTVNMYHGGSAWLRHNLIQKSNMKTIKKQIHHIFETDYILTNTGIYKVIDFDSEDNIWLDNETIAEPINGEYTVVIDPEFFQLLKVCRENAEMISLSEDFHAGIEEEIYRMSAHTLRRAYFNFYKELGLTK